MFNLFTIDTLEYILKTSKKTLYLKCLTTLKHFLFLQKMASRGPGQLLALAPRLAPFLSFSDLSLENKYQPNEGLIIFQL